RGVTLHLKEREVDERGDVLELRVENGLLELADRGVDVVVRLELVEGELDLRVVELRIVRERSLEVRLGFVVVLAALPREARVERRLRELALSGRGAVEHLGDLAARGLVPVARFVVGIERG